MEFIYFVLARSLKTPVMIFFFYRLVLLKYFLINIPIHLFKSCLLDGGKVDIALYTRFYLLPFIQAVQFTAFFVFIHIKNIITCNQISFYI